MATAAKKAPSRPVVQTRQAPAAKAPAKPAPSKKVEPVESELEAGELRVSATLSKAKADELGIEAPTVTVTYNFGTDLEDAVSRFGEQVVFNAFVDSAVIGLQAKLRRHILASVQPSKSGSTTPLPDDPQDLVGDWKPAATGSVRKSAGEKVATLVGKLSPEERAALIARLQAEE